MASSDESESGQKKKYEFGSIKEFSLEEIESEVLNESVYLDVFAGSDVAFKEEIEPLPTALEGLTQLETYTYKYRTDEFAERNFPEGRRFGLMAQEAEKSFPDLVKKDEQGMRHLNYGQLIPVLVKGINELKDLVKKQEQEIEALKRKL